ncbi:major facilitator superfamily domain-containing protein [Microdochium trichocladiopsis]|uniref:Major facilitator superfamily domain-containing protein n=1 Tax=Microdochium trichocladiopsis TaxID=1682393 RepID=A0A9P8Y2N4_9PEZI|nr:major facilitator superfamily domain-containing protein [Microdochium trichocladiopsis]KAH7027754.1 major facilitator superfamily domain-containing protein [Microdochium trichocladiopsis]
MTSVFPYLPEMIASFGVDKDAVAQWAGITSAAFSLAQSVTAVWWGRASDRFGRKPVILTGLMCTMLCFLAWGLSTSLTMAITIRAILGASNGNVGIIRTVVAEMVPEKELQPTAFSIMPLVWSIGSIFGPAFGGFFANPATQFPGVFGDSRFFKAFPFALPNMMGSVIFMISMATAFLFLKETVAHKRGQKDWGLVLGEKLVAFLTGKRQPRRRSVGREDEETLLRSSNGHANHEAPLLSRVQSADRKAKALRKQGLRSVLSPQTTLNLVCYTFLALHSVAFDQLLPVFLHYPVERHTSENVSLPLVFNGGFGLKSGSIGTIFTVYGLLCGLIQFLLYPPIATRFGILNCFKTSLVIMPISYFMLPYTVLIEDTRTKFAALMVIMTFKAVGVIFAFPSSTILLTNSATSLGILATLNGLATTFSALGRATGPAAAGAVFSYGVHRGIVGLPWWMLGTIAMIGAVPAWWIVEGEGPTNSDTTSRNGKPNNSATTSHALSDDPNDTDTDDSYDTFYDTSSDDDNEDNAMTENEVAARRQRRRRASLAAARAQPREIVAQPEGQDDQPLFSTSARSTGSGARRPGYGSIRTVI